MSRSPITSAVAAVILTAALAGCGGAQAPAQRHAVVARSSAGSTAAAVHEPAVARTARSVVEAYLRLEVGEGTSADRARVRASSTHEVGAQLTAVARPGLGGFPPRARLAQLRVLPVVTPGRWVVQARVLRVGVPAFLELQLISGGRGPLVCLFTSTTGAP